ncbi:DUF6783 domain-containing protein [uncultured Robinsoniella sp.]|uniref:DUF6783 domain-containing protein n=1 Tax=uncultured Robinsoniella sp. TaxID=904190 RepID=UPI00374F000E
MHTACRAWCKTCSNFTHIDFSPPSYINAELQPRACLTIHFHHLYAPVCGRFSPNSGYIARYAPCIRDKSTATVTQTWQKAIFRHALSHIIYRKWFLLQPLFLIIV